MIIILCRNNVELSKRCLETLLRQTERTEILLIDNASTDGTHKWLTSVTSQQIWIMNFGTRMSVAECWNEGLKWAFWRGSNNEKTQEVLVVNNDTELRPDTYAVLREALKITRAGMVTCISVREHERMEGEFKLDRPTSLRPHPDFSCFMISKWAYEKVGPFNEAYGGAFAEDAEYHVRMHRAGVPALNTGLPFLHHGSQTVKRADEAERQRICLQADRNRELFYKTYGVRIGTDEYNTLFTPEQFGIVNRAEEQAHSAPSSPPPAQQSE